MANKENFTDNQSLIINYESRLRLLTEFIVLKTELSMDKEKELRMLNELSLHYCDFLKNNMEG